jgi:hypothetical protein
MVRRLIFSVLVAVILGILLYPRASSDVEQHSIVVQADRVSVINLTDTEWSDVEVWLNDRYRVQAPGLAAGQRLDIPIGVFVGGWDRRFDPKRQSPYGLEVTAKGADGKPVRVTWGTGRRR